jgi:hypothetical protein
VVNLGDLLSPRAGLADAAAAAAAAAAAPMSVDGEEDEDDDNGGGKAPASTAAASAASAREEAERGGGGKQRAGAPFGGRPCLVFMDSLNAHRAERIHTALVKCVRGVVLVLVG